MSDVRVSPTPPTSAPPAGRPVDTGASILNLTALPTPQLTPAQQAKYKDSLKALSDAALLKSPELWKQSDGTLDKTAILALIQKIFGETLEDTAATEKQSIKATEKKQQSLIDARLKKIQAMSEKMKQSNNVSLITNIIGWVVAAVSILVGVVVTAASLGTASEAGIAISLIGMGFAVTMTALSESGTMDKMIDAMAKSIAEDFENNQKMDAQEAQFAGGITAQVVTTAIMIAIDIVLVVASFGAASGAVAKSTESALEDGARAATKLAQGASELAETTATTSQELSTLADELAEEAPDLAEELQGLAQLVKELNTGDEPTGLALDEELNAAFADVLEEADTQLNEIQQEKAVAQKAEEIDKRTTRQLKYAHRLQAATQIITAGGQIAGAGVQVKSAELQKSADEDAASAELDRALLVRLRTALRANQQFLREVVEVLMQSNQVVIHVLRANHQANRHLANMPIGV